MIAQVIKCDVCENQRGEANHWFAVTINEYRVTVRTFDSAEKIGILSETKHACGQKCAHALLDQFMSTTSRS